MSLTKVVRASVPERMLVEMIPVVVTQVTPLLISINGDTPISALRIPGATYTTGAALALLTSPGTPVVLPIGA